MEAIEYLSLLFLFTVSPLVFLLLSMYLQKPLSPDFSQGGLRLSYLCMQRMCLYSSRLISVLFHRCCQELLIHTWRLPATSDWFPVHQDVALLNLEKAILKNPSSTSLISGIPLDSSTYVPELSRSIATHMRYESESDTKCLAQYSERSKPCRIPLKAGNLKRKLLWILKYSRDNMIFKIIRRILILPLKKTCFLINIYTVNT